MQAKTKGKKMAIALLAGSLWFGGATLVAKNDNGGGAKSKSSTQTEKKSTSKKVDFTDYEKPSPSKGTTNASLHQKAAQEVVVTLEEVKEKGEPADPQAKKEGAETVSPGQAKKTAPVIDPVKTAEVTETVEEVATSVEETTEETTEAIEAVETRNPLKAVLLGADYKNLGQLRSSLVHNRNDIRKLTQALTLAQTDEEKAAIQTSLDELMGERDRIKTVITDNESSFSLFGWVSRFLLNYEMSPINTDEEDELEEEVEEAIEESGDDAAGDTTTGTGGDTTNGTTGTTPTDTTGGTTTNPTGTTGETGTGSTETPAATN